MRCFCGACRGCYCCSRIVRPTVHPSPACHHGTRGHLIGGPLVKLEVLGWRTLRLAGTFRSVLGDHAPGVRQGRILALPFWWERLGWGKEVGPLKLRRKSLQSGLDFAHEV